jgi:putative (di)nucleoside polyphosphate hydrolase
MENNLPYRKNVCCLILNEDKKFLLVTRPERKSWEFVQGGIEKGETPKDTIKRELFEEIGITEFELIAKSNYNDKYEWNKELREKHGFCGQERQFFLVKLIGNPEIKVDKIELVESKWCNFNEVLENIKYQNLKEAFIQIKKEFLEYF